MRSTTRARWIGVGIVAVVLAASAGSAPADPHGRRSRLEARLAPILDKVPYRYGQWGLLQRDPRSGRTTIDQFSEQFFIPGSTAKLFSVSGPWDVLGGDHRFTTPVRAVGTRTGSRLDGNLVLVAQGDLTMGGRTKPDGSVDFTSVDHTYANDVPGATLTPEDPLAGLDEIARQVRAAGLTEVRGDVVVDDRLFRSFPELDPSPAPLIVNDNVIDLLVTPSTVGAAAALTWRPQVAPYTVTSTVRTVAAGGPTDVAVEESDDGTRITVTGTVAADAQPVLRVSTIKDPSAFGRTALVEALARAGVTVTAGAAGPNPAGKLPASYGPGAPVASYVSPPYADYARLILKVSHNLGANLGICLMAVTAGRRNCEDGFGVLRAFLERAGVDTEQVQLLDGRGGNPVDRATPNAEAQMLEYWLRTPEATRFREALPILGVDGSLSGACTSCPAKGKVFAKTGTVAGFDAVNNRLAVGAETLAGYIDVGGGKYDVIFVGVNGASVPDIQGVVDILDETGDIAAILQEEATRPRRDG